ncbi:Predicted DNA binding protein, contains HTH domain [Halobiforma haloterrestris]|uniref:Predicted DNA binding protein, contains HTH domain n=1 Tax=Natronobacterium haloterrestre TaxID=148448 RepID=A0A1I1EXX3_NATHA|nr:helix-turn-helix domain-containing protein [Halobiforma haloterrestris]SFB91871.1 Predicted DNA binding protein, contains HTH domain [Halobiforma haloterrestris]
MPVIADITVPADAFELGRVLQDFRGVEVELERIVPLRETIIPLFWVSGTEPGEVEDTLAENAETKSVTRLTTTDDKTLFEVQWSEQTDGIVEALIDTGGKILEATGTAETWDFRIRFGDHAQLSAFNQALTDDGVPITLRHLYNPSPPEETSTLSHEQRDALATAYRRGFFEVPRDVTLAELAEEMGISDTALSQRMRRGLAITVEQVVFSESPPE